MSTHQSACEGSKILNIDPIAELSTHTLGQQVYRKSTEAVLHATMQAYKLRIKAQMTDL